MKSLKLALLFSFIASVAFADVKISQLPLKAASSTGVSDSLPFANATLNETDRVLLSDLIHLPAMAAQFSLMIPDQTGQATKFLRTTGSVTAWSQVDSLQGFPVSATPPTNGQVLKYNSGSSQWEAGAAAATGANQTLSNLTNPTSVNQDLVFNGNKSLASNTGGSVTFFNNLLTLTGGAVDTVATNTFFHGTGGNPPNLTIYDGGGVNFAAITVPNGIASYYLTLPPTPGAVGKILYNVDGNGLLDWTDQGADVHLSNLSATTINDHLVPGVDNTINAGSSSLGFANVWANNFQSSLFSNMLISTQQRTGATAGSITLQPGNSLGSFVVGANISLIAGTGKQTGGNLVLTSGIAFNESTGTVMINSSDAEANSHTAAATGAVTLKSGNTTTRTTVNSSSITGAVVVTSGDSHQTGKSGPVSILSGATENGDSGNIILSPALPSGSGTRGVIQVQDGTEGTAGQVIVSADTVGTAHWGSAPGPTGSFSPATDATSNIGDAAHRYITVDAIDFGDGTFATNFNGAPATYGSNGAYLAIAPGDVLGTIYFQPIGSVVTFYSTVSKLEVQMPSMQIDSHLFFHQPVPPTITANCGTTPLVVGSDVAGVITVGSGGTDANCQLTFNTPWTSAPVCQVSTDTDQVTFIVVPTTTTVDFTGATALSAGSKLSYHCVGYN